MTPPGGADPPAADAGADAVRLKQRFDDIYDQPDPRDYVRVLGDLGYRELVHAHQVTTTLLARLSPRLARAQVLDVCCSYGLLGMLLASGCSPAELERRYRDAAAAGWSTRRLADADRALLASRGEAGAPVVHGLDAAPAAVGYARAVGAVVEGFAEDLEADAASQRLCDTMGGIDLVVVAGGVGYVTERTFDRLLRHAPDPPPWIAALVARVYPYERIAGTLAAHGLVTERLTTRTFARRRFADAREQAAALAQLAALGVDAAGREAEGWYHTDLYLSRPAGDAQPPADVLLAGLPVDAPTTPGGPSR